MPTDRSARNRLEDPPRTPRELPANERPGLKAMFTSFGALALIVALFATAVIVALIIAIT